ncbi:AmmeMemoRadiSam system radical SAM enzyme [Bacillus pseudomycoides]|nr:AmmeMemoRadiSam system radical SAM enzyme [Bacillus pseudomycoides]PFX43746.1 AmmeMemoRadiSam system radical SAM enzyme [Bacillus pseudomycoides]
MFKLAQDQQNWRNTHHEAKLWSKLEDGRVQCHLSPRECIMSEGQSGFCNVRKNVDGKLVTLNYGKATQITEESVETEAVFHYAPGSKILSLGNLGCMMNCDYCHNWQTSQAKYVKDKDVQYYTPELVVETALERGIPIISWTYNDPVVWHEFILDTGRIAKEHGLINLYKSAFFISLEGARELCEVIDIFSVSLKSMDEKWYRKISKGWLPPVLEATKYVFDQGKHVEISSLLVTDQNDNDESTKRLADWVLNNLSAETPVHLVRFHPDYKYTHVDRTPIDRLERQRELAMSMGLKYVYLGNCYDTESVNTFCTSCGHKLIERYGLNAHSVGLASDKYCANCSTELPVINLASRSATLKVPELQPGLGESISTKEFNYHGDVKACHVEINNLSDKNSAVIYRRRTSDGSTLGQPISVPVKAGASYRFIISKGFPEEVGIDIEYLNSTMVRVYEVFDRAHYPTEDISVTQGLSDVTPVTSLEFSRK